MADLIPTVNLTPSVSTRVVSIDVVDPQSGKPIADPAWVDFELQCDLHDAADDKIISNGSVRVQLDAGKGSVRLPSFDPDAVTQDGSTDWWIVVRKSWHPSHPYAVRVPAGPGAISLADLLPVRQLKGSEKKYAISSASVSVVEDSTITSPSGSVSLKSGVLSFALRFPPPSIVPRRIALPADANLNNYITEGAYTSIGGRASTIVNSPSIYDFALDVMTVNANLVLQRATVYRSTRDSMEPETWVRSMFGAGSWSAWRRDHQPSVGVRHAILEDEMRRYMPAPDLGSAVPVALIYDHGTENYRDIILPKLKALGLDSSVTLALNSDMYNPSASRYAYDDGTSWTEIDGWACEIANHGRTHSAMNTTEDLRHEIVDGLTELRTNLPKHRIYNWVQTGQSGSTTWQGFANGATADAWATSAAGALIYNHHVASTGSIAAGVEALYTMDGRPKQGVWGYWLDTTAGIASAKTMVGKAVAQRNGIILRAHPEVINGTGNATTADHLAMLDWLKAEQNAGRIRLCTFAQWNLSTGPGKASTQDTGWRTMSSWDASGVVTGLPLPTTCTPQAGQVGWVKVRRIGPQVTFYVRGLTIDTATSFDPAWGLPAEFLTGSQYAVTPCIFTDNTVTQASSGYRRITITATGKSIGTNGFQFPFFTEQAWPAVLPGTAA